MTLSSPITLIMISTIYVLGSKINQIMFNIFFAVIIANPKSKTTGATRNCPR